MRKVILINGLIASGKNTIGKLLTDKLNDSGIKSKFYDIDQEVTRLNPKDKWENDEDKLNTWLKARRNYALAANQDKEEIVVIAGPFFTKDEIGGYIKYIDKNTQIFLFTLNTPLEMRIDRNKNRVPSNNPKDIVEQEKIFQSLQNALKGEIIDNSKDVEVTVSSIMESLENNKGIISYE